MTENKRGLNIMADNIMLYLLNGPCSSLPRSSDIQLNNEDDELFTAIKKKKDCEKRKRIPWQPSVRIPHFH